MLLGVYVSVYVSLPSTFLVCVTQVPEPKIVRQVDRDMVT